MENISAPRFIEIWQEFSEHFKIINPDWLTLYDSSKLWSEKFLGGKTSSEENSPIGNFFREKYPTLRYRTEDGSFDIGFSLNSNFSKLSYLLKENIDFFDAPKFYPVMYDVVIEIENDHRGAWHEMTKLTWVRCPLKVLVTYNWHLTDITIWEKENKILLDTFSTVIHQSNQCYEDNMLTKYLLIIGNNGQGKLNWSYYTLDSDGNLVT